MGDRALAGYGCGPKNQRNLGFAFPDVLKQ